MKKYSLNKDAGNSLQEVLKTILQKVRSLAFSIVLKVLSLATRSLQYRQQQRLGELLSTKFSQ